MLGDVNGDGLADLVYIHESGSPLKVRTMLRRAGRTWAATVEQNFASDPAGMLNHARLGDVQRDGLADLVVPVRSITRWFGCAYALWLGCRLFLVRFSHANVGRRQRCLVTTR